MTEHAYQRISESIRRRPWGERFFTLLDTLLTLVTFLAYPVFLLFFLYTEGWSALRYFFVPAVSFLLVTVFRSLVNERRPYERFDFRPVLKKNTKGKSFPSRHAFSIFMIAMTFLQEDPRLGRTFLIGGVILAVLRVLGGVHFIHDVVAGALLGVILALIGYLLIL